MNEFANIVYFIMPGLLPPYIVEWAEMNLHLREPLYRAIMYHHTSSREVDTNAINLAYSILHVYTV